MSKLFQNGALAVSGMALYGLSVYSSYQLYKIYKAPTPAPNCYEPKHQQPRQGVYDALAPQYDDKIRWDEFMLGIGRRRSQLLEHAVGDVLEISAGTGRNLEHYTPSRLTSLTLTDSSSEMLKQAYKTFQTSTSKPAYDRVNPRFIVMSSQHILDDRHGTKIDETTTAYDTVVDTFGLCSHTDPVAALKEMARVCRKGTGRILLLEHGRTRYWDWLNVVLDKFAADHALDWGVLVESGYSWVYQRS
ncbi:hypothetical protein BASA62_004760 [Batrachochytrium salamandrivorans]|nr:hypothetical protein BASA62_004760 [Batrachochytrium salamandrivorans]